MSCSKINQTELRKQVWPREHLWNETKNLSLDDLVEACYGVTDVVHAETLKPLLLRLRNFCDAHTKQCQHCSELTP